MANYQIFTFVGCFIIAVICIAVPSFIIGWMMNKHEFATGAWLISVLIGSVILALCLFGKTMEGINV